MVKSKSQRPPGFFWRGLLITLPVLVLAAAGFFSLRQDRKSVEGDAKQRAQDLADDLVPRIWFLLTNSAAGGNSPEFTLNAAGELVFPPRIELTLVPQALDGMNLSPVQRDQWHAAREGKSDEHNTHDSQSRWETFLAAAPPSNYLAAAHYTLGLHFLERGDSPAAGQHFQLLAEKFPGARGETGLPLRPLALLKLLTLTKPEQRTASGFNAFCSNVVYQPTLLTPYLLQAAADLAASTPNQHVIDSWADTWSIHQTSRRLAAEFRKATSAPTESTKNIWLTLSTPQAPAGPVSERWLLVHTAGEKGGAHFVCRSEHGLETGLPAALSGSVRIPAYFAAEVRIAGQVLLNPNPPKRSTSPPATPLATAHTPFEQGNELIRVSLLLTDPEALFQQQRTRMLWFGGLIIVAALTALFGFLGAWRAYAKQHRLNELKSNFVSSVSHELRAPIASVRLMAESLDRGKIPEPAKQREYFRFISQECRRLSALIENVLDFARIDQGRKQYEFEAADLAALVRNTATLMEPRAAEHGVNLELQLPSHDPDGGVPCVVDAKAIQQALVNLVDNAIKHSPPKSTVTLGLESGTACRLWVEDHGAGIPPAEHNRIFERFYRLGSELRRETQGVGIGLSIVKHVVDAHGGRIVVRSAVGAGSRFTIELPENIPGQTSRNH